MLKLRKIGFIALLFGLALGGAVGCGGSNPNSFSVIPAGPTFLAVNDTLQFDTDPANLNVTWTVLGGNSNGTITQDGLYTAPPALPTDNLITVQAEQDGVTDTATVSLQTADSLTFSSPDQINDTPVNGAFAGIAVIFQGVSDEIGAGSGRINSGWIGSTGTGSDVFFSQSIDLGAFSPEANLSNDTTSAFNSLILDNNLNPGIFFTSSSGNVLKFSSSTNQGSSFSPPVPVVNPPSGLGEIAASGAVDGNNAYHVTYTEDFSGSPTAKYSKSTDQGATWSAPINVSPSANENGYSYVAVSDNGQTVAICYAEDTGTDTEVFVSVSTDGGNTFTTQTNVSQDAGNDDQFCRVALGPNGAIDVAYQEDNAGDGDILFSSSTNGGSTFSAPVPVNAVTAGNQAFPYMAVDELGRIDIVWADDNNAGGNLIQLGYARSLDGGQTFSNTLIVSPTTATTVVPRGLVHDEAGRLNLQYFSDINSPGTNVDFFYILGQ